MDSIHYSSVGLWLLNLKDRVTTIPAKVVNVVSWIPFLWNDYDYDYSTILRLLEYKISRLRKHVEKHRMHTCWAKDAKQMRRAELVCKRLYKGNYYQMAEHLSIRDSVDYENYMYRQDLEYLGHILKRNIRNWWC